MAKIVTIAEALTALLNREKILRAELTALQDAVRSSQVDSANDPTRSIVERIAARVEEVASREPDVQIIDRTVTKIQQVESQQFDISPVVERIDALSERVDKAGDVGYEFDLPRGRYRFKQPNGEFSPWHHLNSGGGGLGQGQVQTLIDASLPDIPELQVKSSGSLVVANPDAIDFGPSFNVAESPSGTAYVTIDTTLFTSLEYLGTWDASTNTPTITTGTHAGTNGDFYLVATSGSTLVDGESTWNVGDVIIWNSDLTQWQKVGTLSQNIWATVQADTGSTTTNAPNDTLSILGDGDVATSITGDTLTLDASALRTDIDTNATNISNLDGRVTTNEGDIATNTTNINTNSTDISNLDDRVTVNEGDISTNTTNISNNTDAIADLEASTYASTAIRVEATGSQNLTANASTVVAWDTINHTVGSLGFDNANDEIDIVADGIYNINLMLRFDPPAIGVLSNIALEIEVDTGAGFNPIAEELVQNGVISGGAAFTLHCSTDWNLSAGDKIRALMTYNSTLGGILAIIFPTTNAPINHMAVHRVA